METFLVIIEKLTEFSSLPSLVILLGGGIFLTIKLGFFQFRKFHHIMKNTINDILTKTEGDGTITPFQAATSATAATIGAANIVGVPVAIAMGGPGSIFWMWIVALLGMATKYSEVVLGFKYRLKNKAGDYVGGPMYYMSEGLGLKWMATLYVVISAFTMFASISVQANSLSGIINGSFNISPLTTGLVISFLIVLVTLGGIKSIGKFAEKSVPAMAIIYFLVAFLVIIFNLKHIQEAFNLILNYAFKPIAAAGGFTGASLAAIIRAGVARGLYSNEAGVGSAAIAHSSATNEHPVKQGFWGVFEVFLDTIVVCTITAFLVLTTGVWKNVGVNSAAQMPVKAMSTVFGSNLARIIISAMIFIFAFTTLLVLIYYGEKMVEYLLGHRVSIIARFFYISAIVIGSIGTLNLIWSMLDIMFALTIIPNMVAVLLLSDKVKEITDDYFRNYRIKN